MPTETPTPTTEPPEGDGGGREYKTPATQADLDRIVETRLAQERKKFEGFDEYKAKADAYDKAEADKLGDLEKAQQAAATATAERDAALARANTTLVQAAVMGSASKLGAVDPVDVYALLKRDPKTGLPEGVVIGDDGQITGADAAVKALLDTKPHLVGRRPPSFDGGADRGTPPPAGNGDMNAFLSRAAANRR